LESQKTNITKPHHNPISANRKQFNTNPHPTHLRSTMQPTGQNPADFPKSSNPNPVPNPAHTLLPANAARSVLKGTPVVIRTPGPSGDRFYSDRVVCFWRS